MQNIILISHGSMAEGVKASLEMIVGKQDHVHVVALTPDGDNRQFEEELLKKMGENHLHILNTGELETLLLPFDIPYTNNKSHWVVSAINKIASLSKKDVEENENIYKFIEEIVLS